MTWCSTKGVTQNGRSRVFCAIPRCGLLLALSLSPAIPAPAVQALPESQQKVIDAARAYSERYSQNLPSFICVQTIDQFQGDKKGRHWHKGDTLTSQLAMDKGREKRILQFVNNKPVMDQRVWSSPLVTEGEFGNLLDSVLGAAYQTMFAFHGWENLDSRRLAVFGYHVDQQHSTLRLSLGSYDTIVPFSGLLYVDENSGIVWRITTSADQFPTELRTRSVARSVDYGEVSIGENRYVLPVRATVLLDTGHGNIRNELRFEGYRKFTAESHISFGPDDPPKD